MKKYIFFILVIFFLGLALRLFNLGAGPMTGDESVTAIRAYWVAVGILTGNIKDLYGFIVSPRPPADILSVLPAVFLGMSEGSLRLAGVTVSLLSIVVILFSLRSLLPNKQVLLIGFLLAVSPMVIGWSRLATADSLEMAMSGILVAVMIRNVTKPTTISLVLLLTIFGFSLWIVETFIVLFPLILFISWFSFIRGHLKVKVLVLTYLIFGLIVGLAWVPRFIGSSFLPVSLGVNYQLTKVRFPNILENCRYYLRTYFIDLSVLPLFLVWLVGLFHRKSRTDKIFLVSSTYFFIYAVFFLLVFWRHQAYLGAAYIPLLIAASRACFLILKHKTANLLHLLVGLYFLFLSITYLIQGHSDSIAVWGFNKSSEITRAAMIIRKCTLPADKVISDIDGYAQALYFDRKYYQEQDKIGLDETLSKYASRAGAIYLTARYRKQFGLSLTVKTPKYFSDGSVIYIDPSCTVGPGSDIISSYYEKYWRLPGLISFYR